MIDAAAILLVGGRSSRMGTPKAGLLFDGVPLLVHLCRRLTSAFPEVVVVRAPGQELPRGEEGPPLPIAVVEDRVPDQGPVAGLCAGLAAIRHPLAFVATCDVPFLNPRLGVWMIGQADGEGPLASYDVVVPEWEGRLHPLQAVYRARVLPLLEEQLAKGHRRPIDLYERVCVRKVTEAEVRAVDPLGRTFLNMNTPEEYERALVIWRESCMPVNVELLGVARVLARKCAVSLVAPPGGTLRDVTRALAVKYPRLVGPVLRSDGSLAPGVVYSEDGRTVCADVDRPVREVGPGGETSAARLLLIPSLEGG